MALPFGQWISEAMHGLDGNGEVLCIHGTSSSVGCTVESIGWPRSEDGYTGDYNRNSNA